MSINAVEGYPLEDFSAEAVRAQITEAQKVANGSGSEQDIAEAKIELEVRRESNVCLVLHLLTMLGSGELASRSKIDYIENGYHATDNLYIRIIPYNFRKRVDKLCMLLSAGAVSLVVNAPACFPYRSYRPKLSQMSRYFACSYIASMSPEDPSP